MVDIFQAYHPLKVWPEFFNALLDGSKKFELRKYDRAFITGDILLLKEYDNITNMYTGRFIHKKVEYVLIGPTFGLEHGYVIMSLGDFYENNFDY